MKKKLIAIVLTGLALTVATESAMAASINDRQRNQKERIARGQIPGNGLNFREASKLIDAQRNIRRLERQYSNSGAGLNAYERRQLQNRLDVQNQRIKQFRQN